MLKLSKEADCILTSGEGSEPQVEQPVPVMMAADASGARVAGLRRDVVVIVDVIHMTTSLETALVAGATAVYGASPNGVELPLPLDPRAIGKKAGQQAVQLGTAVVIIAEPRLGTDAERRQQAQAVIAGVEQTGAQVEVVLPNWGADLKSAWEWQGRVVVAVSEAGGVAFDAAHTAGGAVVTGTIARVGKLVGLEPARTAALRALALARERQVGITVVAASARAWEDVLGAQCIAQCLLQLERPAN